MWRKQKSFYLETEMLKAGWLNIYTSARAGDMRQKNIRNKFLKKLGLRQRDIITLEQVHDDKIAVIKEINTREILLKKADGAVIKSPEINPVLIVFTADCLGITAVSPSTGEYGIVHAGWRGLLKKIIFQFFSKFSQTRDLIVAIGPHIHKCCYPVSSEIGKKFGKFFHNGCLDLTAVARKQISCWKIKKIIIHPDCTGHKQNFFSWRREQSPARQMNFLVRMPLLRSQKWIS